MFKLTSSWPPAHVEGGVRVAANDTRSGGAGAAGAAVAAGAAAAVVEDELEAAAVVDDELEAAVEVVLEAAALEDSSSPLLHATISITAISPTIIVTQLPRSNRAIMIPPQIIRNFRRRSQEIKFPNPTRRIGKYSSTL